MLQISRFRGGERDCRSLTLGEINRATHHQSLDNGAHEHKSPRIGDGGGGHVFSRQGKAPALLAHGQKRTVLSHHCPQTNRCKSQSEVQRRQPSKSTQRKHGNSCLTHARSVVRDKSQNTGNGTQDRGDPGAVDAHEGIHTVGVGERPTVVSLERWVGGWVGGLVG